MEDRKKMNFVNIQEICGHYTEEIIGYCNCTHPFRPNDGVCHEFACPINNKLLDYKKRIVYSDIIQMSKAPSFLSKKTLKKIKSHKLKRNKNQLN